MKLQELKKIIREEIALLEKSRTGLPGAAEKDINIALRDAYKEDNINYGGCGAMAKLLYYACKKYLGITPKIVVIFTTYNDRISYAKHVNLNDYDSIGSLVNSEQMFLSHVVIQIPGTNVCLDSNGWHSLNWYLNEYTKHIVPAAQAFASTVANDTLEVSTLSKWLNISMEWNSTFNRSRIPDLAKHVDEIMKKVSEMPELQSKLKSVS